MRIFVITDSIRGISTGIGYYAKEFIKELEKKRDASLIYLDYETTAFNKNKVKLIPNIFPFLRTYLWAFFLPILTYLSGGKDDIVINLSGIPHFFPYRQKEILLVYDISFLLFPDAHPFLRVLWYKLFFKTTLKNSSKIYTISESSKRDLIKYYKVKEEKVTIVYPNMPSFPNRESRPQKIKKDKFILYVGTIEPRKNIATLIKAFAQLPKEMRTLHPLVIAGKNGWKYEDIYSLVTRLNVGNDIIFLGYISDEEKKYLYKHAIVFVYPSIYEGFGIPVLEAMNYKCPVITTDISSLPEVVGNSCPTVTPYDITELSKHIMRMIKDSIYREKIVRKQTLQTKKFTDITIHYPLI